MKMELTPFIMLDGQAGEAIAYYERMLEAKTVFRQSYGEAPEPDAKLLPRDIQDRVAHAVLKVDEATLFVSDFHPDRPLAQGSQVNICITMRDSGEAERLYAAVAEEGQVILPLVETHFSPAYGMVTDKFGVTFQIFTARQ